MKRIMIVEDEMVIAEDIKKIIDNENYEVCAIIDNGEEVIPQVKALKPDLVLMDIKLSGEKSGSEIAEILYHKYGIPIIFITSCADDETLNKAKLSEPFGYLIKPIRDNSLIAILRMTFYKLEINKDRIFDYPSVHRKREIAKRKKDKPGLLKRIIKAIINII